MTTAGLGAVLCLIVFTLGAGAAEMALRPPRRPVALVCPCLSHMRCQSVAISARDGVALKGWYYEPETTNGKAVILLHGIGSNREDMVALGHFFLRQGYDVLEPDLRGHGESGGLATYGVIEGNDLHGWLRWLDTNGHSPAIYGFGASLGAAVMLQSLADTRPGPHFNAIVAESSYFDFPSIARERIARELPNGAKWISVPFVKSGIGWASWHDGVDLTAASPAHSLKISRVPVLLIHGMEDDKTSPDNSRRLASLNPAVQLWLVPGSHHADAWKTATTDFESRVSGWFSTH